MGKPRLIILVRHGQSEGNKNRDIHQTIPDHRVKLTPDGWQQAYEAGRRLRQMLRADDTLHFFTSPYRRARETTEGILTTLTSDESAPSAFQRQNIKVYEEPRLREQDFGNFQPCSAEMERMWQERADYGHFFYRIPNGESAADAYDRISGFNESLWRQFGEDDFASVCVLVTHGLMSRVFLMKWYHFSVEYFEDLRNINHCEFLIMRKSEESGKFVLENNLRTWSDLKRERAALRASNEREGKELSKEDAVKEGGHSSKDSSKLEKTLSINSPVAASPIEKGRKWGGCPNGCNHDKTFKIRSNMADLVKSDSIISREAVGLPVESNEDGVAYESGSGSGSSALTPSSITVTDGCVFGQDNNGAFTTVHGASIVSRRPAAKRFQSIGGSDDVSAEEAFGPHIDIAKACDEVVSSPDGTPSFISVEDRLRGHIRSPNTPPAPLGASRGRDFGGTRSGHNSTVASEADSSEDDGVRRRVARLRLTTLSGGLGADADSKSANGQGQGQGSTTTHVRERSGMGRGTRANRLGDHPHGSDDSEHDADVEHDHEDDEVRPREKTQESQPDSTRELDTNDLERVSTAQFQEAEREDKNFEGSVY